MKLALFGAFLFLVANSTVWYLLVNDDPRALFAVPFMFSLILVPIGLSKEEKQ